jgi:hypothetical protein
MAPAGSVTRTAPAGRASEGNRTRLALWWLPRNVDGRRGAHAAGLGVLVGVAGVVTVDGLVGSACS